MPETPYVETEALLAVMNEDDERLFNVLDRMLPNELATLRDQALELVSAIDRHQGA